MMADQAVMPAPQTSAFVHAAEHHMRHPFPTRRSSDLKEATVTIRDGTLQVQEGHQGKADLGATADSETWLGFLAKERSLLWALLRRRVRIKGSPKLLVAFGKCFPS